MHQTLLPSSLKRVLNLSAVLIFISSFVVIILGQAAFSLHQEIKMLNQFLINAADVQPNFEKSLTIYTENTKEVIAYLLLLRPSSDMEYITFISEVEDIGQRLSLNLNLKSVDATDSEPTETNTLVYDVSFYGNQTNLTNFLYELEQLPYFIKAKEIRYKSLETSAMDEETLPNITLRIHLHVK